jgi:hypothetical protein
VVRVGADIAPVITAFTRRRPFGHQQAARRARAGEGKLQMQPVDRRMMARSAFGTVRGRVVVAAPDDAQNLGLL